jgi:mannitol-1-/sugar-/sorbitol-6-phosphatase
VSNAQYDLPGAPEAFLFDLDGTLVDSERENVESVVLAARRHGVELTEEERLFIVGHSWNEIYAMISRNHGLTLPMRELIAQAVEEKRAILAASGHRALPGAVALVRRLAGRAKLALVTGASRHEALDALAGIGVLDLFQAIVAAEDYSRGKPAPEPYQRGLALLGAAPARTLVVEDATPGIQSARAAGLRVVAVRAGNFVGYDLSGAHRVVDTLDELTDQFCAEVLA